MVRDTTAQLLGKRSKRVGIVTFTEPRKEVKFAFRREEYIQSEHLKLKSFLERNGFTVVDPHSKKIDKGKNWGIYTLDTLKSVVDLFFKERVEAIICGCWSWTEPHLPLALLRQLNLPVALITRENKDWPGITSIASVGASFWESSPNFFVKHHSRFIVSNESSYYNILSWAKAATSIMHLKRSSLLLWGSGIALNMEHLLDDIPKLKRMFVGEILAEDQSFLVRTAEELLANHPELIEDFERFLVDNGCTIVLDGKMTTKEIVQKQIALYFAARKRIEYYKKNGRKVIGASIKCQPELSVDYGITPCLLPALLPFEYKKNNQESSVIPTVCENDLKGLISSVILHSLNPAVPPLFGDLKAVSDDYFLLANCGGGSAYYAALSDDPGKNLKNSFIRPQCQGKSGGAFGYKTPEQKDPVTYARLCRIDGKYFMQAGLGSIMTIKEEIEMNWGGTWPHTAVSLGVPAELFVQAVGSNHLSLTVGDFIPELVYFCKLSGIKIIRIDKQKELQRFVTNLC